MIWFRRVATVLASIALLMTALDRGALASVPAGPASATQQATAQALQALRDEYAVLITGTPRPLVANISESGITQTGPERLAATLRRRDFDAQYGLTFISASVQLVDVSVETSPTQLVLRATEVFQLGYQSSHYAHDVARDVTGGQTRHTFTLALRAGLWELQNDGNEHQPAVPQTPDPAGVPAGKPAEMIRPVNLKQGGGSGVLASPLFSGWYDYQTAAYYADQYVYSHNPAYRDFTPDDCTNFVSQSLAAGGWQQIAGFTWDWSAWAYGSSSQTQTWVNVAAMKSFMQTSGRAQFMGYLTDMLIGDIIQVQGDIQHTMIVDDRISGTLDGIFVTYHSVDHLHRPLVDFLAVEPMSSNNYYAEHIVGTF